MSSVLTGSSLENPTKALVSLSFFTREMLLKSECRQGSYLSTGKLTEWNSKASLPLELISFLYSAIRYSSSDMFSVTSGNPSMLFIFLVNASNNSSALTPFVSAIIFMYTLSISPFIL